jgi:hypothetical protein
MCHLLTHSRGLFPTNVFREKVRIKVHRPNSGAESDGIKEGGCNGDHGNSDTTYRSGKSNHNTKGGDGQAKSGEGQTEEDRGGDDEYGPTKIRFPDAVESWGNPLMESVSSMPGGGNCSCYSSLDLSSAL